MHSLYPPPLGEGSSSSVTSPWPRAPQRSHSVCPEWESPSSLCPQTASSYFLLPNALSVPRGLPGLQSLRPAALPSTCGPAFQMWPLLTPTLGPSCRPSSPLRHPHHHSSRSAHPPSAPSLPSPLKPCLGPMTPLLYHPWGPVVSK